MRMPNMELSEEDVELLHEAMQRFTRSVGGDLSRDKNPSTENKDKMAHALELGERIEKLVKESEEDGTIEKSEEDLGAPGPGIMVHRGRGNLP